MKRGYGSLFITSNTTLKGTVLRLPKVLLILVVCLLIGGGIGLINCFRFAYTYVYVKFGVYSLERQNHQLNLKLRFLGKLAEQKEKTMHALINFEDKARLKYGMNTISEDVRLAGIGGKPSLEEEILTSMQDPLLKKAGTIQQSIESLIRQTVLQDSTFTRLSAHVLRLNDHWTQRPSIWPAHGKITSGFGYRVHPIFNQTIFHEGLDIANSVWTPVIASASGMVSYAGTQSDYGLIIKINHDGGGFVTCYAHLVQAAVEEGQVVNRGELIGYVGNSGRSTGPHLHYEVHAQGKLDNPLFYILPAESVVD
jgi:murein DD-endopeptidase MepM/ murein hydrolase activator NlpD